MGEHDPDARHGRHTALGERQGWLFEASFKASFNGSVNGSFNGSFNGSIKIREADPRISSNGGLLLWREADHRLGLTADLGAKLNDPRDPNARRYTRTEPLRQHVYGLAMGDARQDDQDTLAHDVAMKRSAWGRGGDRVVHGKDKPSFFSRRQIVESTTGTAQPRPQVPRRQTPPPRSRRAMPPPRLPRRAPRSKTPMDSCERFLSQGWDYSILTAVQRSITPPARRGAGSRFPDGGGRSASAGSAAEVAAGLLPPAELLRADLRLGLHDPRRCGYAAVAVG